MNRKDVIRMAREAGLPKWYQDDALVNESLVLKFASLVAAAEREECAKVADTYDVAEDVCSSDTAEGISIAIRARGQ